MCTDILLRKHRIILPLHCSASASPAWRCNIIALQSCWLLQCLGTLASQSKLDFCSRRGTQMSIMKGKAKTGWNVFRVFLPFPVLFLCKQWHVGGLKRKAMTKGNNHWSQTTGARSSSDNWDFAATVWSPWFRPRFSLLRRNHRETPGERVHLLRRRKEVFVQNYPDGRALGQILILTLRLTGQAQLSLMHIWRAGVAALSR